MTTPRTKTQVVVIDADTLSTRRRNYWMSLAKRLSHVVDVVDPDRRPMKELREMFKPGTVVYRASTGGRWGKSSNVVTL